MFAPTLAGAQTCASLQAELMGSSGTALGIAADYPKTHMAIVACMVGSDNSTDAGGCAIAVIVTACFGLTRGECDDLGYRWERVVNTYKRVTARMRELGCRS
ncbi:hypothetical protein [Sphingobium cupriresistens]|uniref:Uncharacterized protein n=1 Tax=Sphingobium cupriresistens TaxID=1132417 RepID=A0A8G2DUS6_9SPHN|nr:hypothetical protein [Sphingobium cupriresistens]RYM04936.1 hypothetical protein EWH12_21675 [Sphingobium cupriresistens]